MDVRMRRSRFPILASVAQFQLARWIGFISGIAGLLASYHFNLPSGPAIVLIAGLQYLLSVVLGSRGGLMKQYFPQPHYHT